MITKDAHLLYSESINAFLIRAKTLCMQILSNEMGIKTHRARFEIKNLRYPLHLVLFEGPTTLGYFNADLYEIGLNKIFMYDDEHLLNTLRHELAHYICYILHGDLTHSAGFRSLCQSYGWGKEVYLARTAQSDSIDSAQRMANKVQKLLNLSASRNEHEARGALKKAHSLLTEYKPTNDALIVKRLLFAKRCPPKWQAMMAIAKEFGVYPIVNRATSGSYLEVFGSKAHVLTAEYIIHFLNDEFDRLAKRAKPKNRHAFFDGIAKGYKQTLSGSALIPIQGNIELAYPHLRTLKSTRKSCLASHAAGKRAGKKLKIREAIPKTFSKLQIDWRKQK